MEQSYLIHINLLEDTDQRILVVFNVIFIYLPWLHNFKSVKTWDEQIDDVF